jgi:bifunctional non-homologous end joining protein LigD
LKRLDKVLFPRAELTKKDLIDYYEAAAPRLLAHLRDRLLVVERFPDGIQTDGFFQKETPEYFPEWIDRQEIEKAEGGRITHVVCGNLATLVYLANQAAVALHPWLSRRDRPGYPDQMVFDLDPAGDSFDVAREAARHMRAVLAELGLPAYLKATGSRGLHVVVPLDRRAGFDEVREVARQIARLAVAREPDHLTIEPRKSKRHGRLLIDYLRNSFGQTAVAPYSVRARPGAPVAVPLDWSELDDPHLRSGSYRIDNVRSRLSQKTDPWNGMARHARSLRGLGERLEKRLA